MRCFRACLAVGVYLMLSGSAFTQQSTQDLQPLTQTTQPGPQSPQRDAQALVVIQNALAAMGRVPADSTATGTVTLVEGSTTSNGTIRILTRGIDQSSETIQLPNQSRLAIYSKGQAAEGFTAPTAPASMELAASSHSPDYPLPYIAAAFSNADFSLQYVGQETLNGSSVHHIRLFDTYASNQGLQPLSEFTTKDLWLDMASGLPRKITYQRREAGGSAPSFAMGVDYSDWHNVNGTLYPYQIQKSWNGTPWATITIQNVSLQTGLTDNDFPVPQTVDQVGVGQ